MRNHRAFTLIELLVSVTLGVGMIAIAWTGFRQSLQTARRTQAVVAAHQTARFTYEHIARELGAALNVGACYLRVDPPTAANAANPHDGQVTFVTLGTKTNRDNFLDATGELNQTGDTRWYMLRYTKRKPLIDVNGITIEQAGVFSQATSTPRPRFGDVRSGENNMKYGREVYYGHKDSGLNSSARMRILPMPVRVLNTIDPDTGWPTYAGGDWDRDILGFERGTWGMKVYTGTTAPTTWNPAGISSQLTRPTWIDFGDHEDLQRNLEVFATGIDGFTITIQNTDGTTATGTTQGATAVSETFWDGIPLDGFPGFHLLPPGHPSTPDKISATIDTHGKRPATVTLDFILRDVAKDIQIPFHCSIPMSAIQP